MSLVFLRALPLERKALIQGEQPEAGSHQLLLKRSSTKESEGQRLLHRLSVDPSEVVDPQPSPWSQHQIEIAQGLHKSMPVVIETTTSKL